MSSPASDLLEAIPATAKSVLLTGRELAGQRDLWARRNPQAAIEISPEPAAGPAGRELDAAILSIDELGEEAVTTGARRLTAGGTLALSGTGASVTRLSSLLEQTGFALDRVIGGVTATAPAIARYLRADRMPPRLCVTAHTINPESGTLSTAVARVRVHEPLAQLSSLPGVRCQAWLGKGGLAFDRNADNILLVQRQLFFDPERYLRPFHSNRFITVAEFDDLLLEGGFTLDLYQSNLSRYHAIQASTPELADFLRQFNPEVAIFGNHLPQLRPRQPKPVQPVQPVRILFAAIGRKEAWRQIVQGCRDVAAEHGDKVATIVVGDREFFDALKPPNGTFLPVLDHGDYLDQLRQADIALLPLADNRFDRSKSDLKYLECAEAGTAVLASHVVYGTSVRSGETGLVYRDGDEFKTHLRRLIEDAGLRERLAANAHRFVSEERMLANQVQRQYAWYRSLLDRRDELTRAIAGRVGQS